MSIDPTKSHGSKGAFKLNANHLRYIAAFIKGRGKGGLLEEDWIELSCSDDMPEGASGATLQVLWDREVDKARIRVGGNKQKPVDETILKAVGLWDKKKNVPDNNEKPSFSKHCGNLKSSTKPKQTSTPNTSSNQVISLLSDDDDDMKGERCDSNDSFDMKYPPFKLDSRNSNESVKKETDTTEEEDFKTIDTISAFNMSKPGTSKQADFSSFNICKPGTSKQADSSSFNISKPGTSKQSESSAFKRAHPGSTNESKKTKLSLQYLGLEKLSEGNDLTCYWAGQFVEAFKSHTQELVELNKSIRLLVDENRGININSKDLVDQITNAYLAERIKKIKKVAVQADSAQENVEVPITQDYRSLQNVNPGIDGNNADQHDHADDPTVNIKQEPNFLLTDEDQESDNEADLDNEEFEFEE